MAISARTSTTALRSLQACRNERNSVLQANLQLQSSSFRTISIRHSRTYSSTSEPDLKSTLREAIPKKRELLKKLKSHASKAIGEVKVENTIGGMRSADY